MKSLKQKIDGFLQRKTERFACRIAMLTARYVIDAVFGEVGMDELKQCKDKSSCAKIYLKTIDKRLGTINERWYGSGENKINNKLG